MHRYSEEFVRNATQKLGLPFFSNHQLLLAALTHRSALNEYPELTESYERLEFLGDAVIELITTRFLFERFSNDAEGKLTALRSALVKTSALASVAQTLGLDQILILSRGEDQAGGRVNIGLLADGFEAVIGALYLDQGLDAAATYLNTHLLHQVDEIVTLELYRDPKSRLQERVQGAGLASPYYQLLKAEGPDHERMFTMEVVIGTESMGSGVARSKQEAEQEAATQALEKLANLAYTTTSKSNNT